VAGVFMMKMRNLLEMKMMMRRIKIRYTVVSATA
jgi:hypothetical protein